MILSVIGYILIRPYIEKFFKVMHERERAKRKEKEKEQKEKDGVKGKKAKVSANALRNQGSGKVLGEVQESDDEIESGDSDEEEEVEENVNENDIPDEEDEGKASGVPEWGRHARKRQKKYLKGLEKNRIAEPVSLSDEQMLEMLDWSESEEEKAGNDATAAA